MKSLNALGLFGTLVLFLGLITIPLFAQEQQGSQDPSAQPQTEQSQPQGEQQVQTFTGTIVKSKGGLALKDEASNMTYKLDNEEMAKRYVGKTVKVTGTVDPATNTIHVSNIEMPSKG